MPYIKVDQENSGPVELYYEDHGSGPATPPSTSHPARTRTHEEPADV